MIRPIRKPKGPIGFWTCDDVQYWFRNNSSMGSLFGKYGRLLAEHNFSGKTLAHLTDDMLLKIGVYIKEDRDAILRHVLAQKLKADLDELSALITNEL